MKNTLENKAKFFGQYHGIKCHRNIKMSGNLTNILKGWYLDDLTQWDFLELKPVSSISDEDAIKLLKLDYRDKIKSDLIIESINREKNGLIISFKFKDVDGIHEKVSDGYYHTEWGINLKIPDKKYNDILRGNGYAVNIDTAEGETVTIEEQIEFGWIKLKQ